MGAWNFIHAYYKLFFLIRMKFQFPTSLQWVKVVFTFLQIFVLLCNIGPPSSLYLVGLRISSTMKYAQSVGFFLTWIFGTDNYLFDSTIFLAAHIIAIITFFNAVQRTKKGTFIPYWMLSSIRLYSQFYCPMITIPQYYRLAYLIERFTIKIEVQLFFSLIFNIFNILTVWFFSYLASIFLIPIHFLRYGILDIYEDKFCIQNLTIRLIFIVMTLLFDLIKIETLKIVIAVVLILADFSLIYYRSMTTVHTSVVGQFFELAALLSTPFMLIFHMFAERSWYFEAIFGISLLFFFGFYFKAQHKIMVRQAIKIFSVFMNNDDHQKDYNNNKTNNITLPKLIPGNLGSVVRLVSEKYPNPAVFEKFLVAQKKIGCRTSHLIEVVRFMGIFPSKRKQMLTEIEKASSNSNYNRYTLYLYKKILVSLVEPMPLKIETTIQSIATAYLSSFALYWESRMKKKYFDSFKYGLNTAYYFIEAKYEIKMLNFRFPYDPAAPYHTALFALTTRGDFNEYKKNRILCDNLERKKVTISDPLLHPMTHFNPKILQFCKVDKSKSDSSTNSVHDVINTKHSSNSRNSDVFKSSVATFLTISKKLVPFFSVLHFLLPMAFLITFMAFAHPIESYTSTRAREIAHMINDFRDEFFASTPELFVPFIVEKISESDQTIPVCQDSLFVLPLLVFDFFELNQALTTLSNISKIGINYQQYRNDINNNEDECSILEHTYKYYELNSVNTIKNLKNNLINSFQEINELYNHIQMSYHMKIFEIASFITTIIILILFFMILFIQLNTLANFPEEAKTYLSSKERFTLMLMDRNEEGWELLRKFLPCYKNSIPIVPSLWIHSSASSSSSLGAALSPRSGMMIMRRNCNSMNYGKLIDAKTIAENLSSSSGIQLQQQFQLRQQQQQIQPNSLQIKRNPQQMQQNSQQLQQNSQQLPQNSQQLQQNSQQLQQNSQQLQQNSQQLPQNSQQLQQNSQVIKKRNSPQIQSHLMQLRSGEKRSTNVSFIGLADLAYKTQFSISQNVFASSGNIDDDKGVHSDTTENDLIPSNSASSVSDAANLSQNLNSNPFINNNNNGNASGNTSGSAFNMSDVESNAENNDENNNDFVNSTFEKQTKNRSCWFVISYFLAPWCLFMALFALLYWPITVRVNQETTKTKAVLALEDHMNASFYILYCAYFIALTDEVTHENKYLLNESINQLSLLTTQISKSFFMKQCFSLSHLYCTSIHEIAQNMIDEKFTNFEMVNDVMPSLMIFLKETLSDVYYRVVVDLAEIAHSADYCFFILFGCVLIMWVYLGSLFESEMNQAFNTLFHFPLEFLKDPQKQSTEDILKSNDMILPSEILFIASVADSDEIYSVSDNAQTVLNRPAAEFICRKFSATFPLVKEGFREHLMPDKKSTKLFRCSQTQIGKLVKTLMIEEPKTESKIPVDQIVKKLVNFMPTPFAKLLVSENLKEFCYNNCTIIMMRAKASMPLNMSDKVFDLVNRSLCNFSSLDLLESNGSLMMFMTKIGVDVLIPFLFVRDLIADANQIARGNDANNPLFSFAIQKVDEINIKTIVDNVREPYIDVKFSQYNYLMLELFMLPSKSIAVDIITANDVKLKNGKDENGFIKLSFIDFVSFMNSL